MSLPPSRLVEFLFTLARDAVPFGEVERLISETEHMPTPAYTSSHLAAWAEAAAARLMAPDRGSAHRINPDPDHTVRVLLDVADKRAAKFEAQFEEALGLLMEALSHGPPANPPYHPKGFWGRLESFLLRFPARPAAPPEMRLLKEIQKSVEDHRSDAAKDLARDIDKGHLLPREVDPYE